MQEIKKLYLVDEENRRVAVQIDLKTFQQIEEVLENCFLLESMRETNVEEALDIAVAKRHYAGLDKAK
ncbi:MAG: hypothetical protein JF614_16075 [Acidobacteria bacterium]|nr:hypothetical protein [Acidobacteriota bacterium]